MRKNIVAGNWKMNKTYNEAITLIDKLVEGFEKKIITNSTQVIIAPPFPYLTYAVQKVSNNGSLSIAAQNCHSEDKGAYTGEISATMLSSTGVKYVIIGHSERRAYFNEEESFLSLKVRAAIKNNLTPIYCCGETLPERKNENQYLVVQKQLENGLFVLDENDILKSVIAYEPVWAIGTGVTATPAQAQKMHAFIRQLLEKKYGDQTAQNISILYGGSCNPANAGELFANPDVDGGLIGGASLTADDFIAIVNSF